MTGPLRRRFDELRLATALLTRLPTGRIADPAPSLAAARWAYPLIGLIAGTLCWVALHGALVLGFAPLVAALIALAAMALLTGGLHHDGIADFADGIGGGRDRKHSLAIMRDSRIGSYGVLSLIFIVCLCAAALSDIAGRLSFATALSVPILSRFMMVYVLLLLPPARTDGMGHDASSKQTFVTAPVIWISATMIATGLILTLIMGAIGLVMLACMAFTTIIVALLAYRRLGGQTGDVLGATQITSETAGWLVLSAIFQE